MSKNEKFIRKWRKRNLTEVPADRLIYVENTLHTVRKYIGLYNVEKELISVVYRIFIKILIEHNLTITQIRLIFLDIKNTIKTVKFDNDNHYSKYIKSFVSTYERQNKKIESKSLNDIIESLQTSKLNSTTEYMKLLTNDRGIIYKEEFDELRKSVKNNKGWEHKRIENLTEEKILEMNDDANKFLDENKVYVYNEKYENNIDTLLDYLIQYVANNNPYPFLKFSETFDINDEPKYFNNVINFKEKYNEVLNSPMILKLKANYEQWKNISNIGDFNKFFVAQIHEMIELLISYYQINLLIEIDSKHCHNLAYKILMHFDDVNKFDPQVYMEKYLTASKNKAFKHLDDLFITDFINIYYPERKLKLF